MKKIILLNIFILCSGFLKAQYNDMYYQQQLQQYGNYLNQMGQQMMNNVKFTFDHYKLFDNTTLYVSGSNMTSVINVIYYVGSRFYSVELKKLGNNESGNPVYSDDSRQLMLVNWKNDQGQKVMTAYLNNQNSGDYVECSEAAAKAAQVACTKVLGDDEGELYFGTIEASQKGISNAIIQHSPTGTASSAGTKTEKRTPCSFCNGKGRVHSDDVTSYGLSNKWCDGCQKTVSASHCHLCKTCPSCLGKGYNVKYEYKP